jgi:predicted  nucleic acid-binding Zn-ribbon protein
MDLNQAIIASNGNNTLMVGIIIMQTMQILLQAYQMFLDNQKARHHIQVKDFQEKIAMLEKQFKDNEIKTNREIAELKERNVQLEKEIFDLKQENAELKGLLSSQEKKEELIKKYVENTNKKKN